MAADFGNWLLVAIPVFCFGFPFVMAWYWMIGASLFWLGAERHFPPVDQPPPMKRYPPISIIIPCHNEADNAWETFGVLDAVDYPDLGSPFNRSWFPASTGGSGQASPGWVGALVDVEA